MTRIKAHHALIERHEIIKEGYDNYSLYFWVSGLSVLIGGFFGLSGVAAFIVSIIFFYYTGKLHRHLHKHLNK